MSNRYNQHMNNHFSGCRLLAKAYDPYRFRNVELRLIPGEFDVIGITDGVDAWVSPTCIDPFSVGLPKLIEEFRLTGKVSNIDTTVRTRHVIPPDVIARIKEAELPRRRNVVPT